MPVFCSLQFGKQATLAQLVEHSIRNRKVVGSNPTGGSDNVNNFNEIMDHNCVIYLNLCKDLTHNDYPLFLPIKGFQ